MIKLRRILCPTDFSDFSNKAILYACELAATFRAELHLLHVLHDYDVTAPIAGETYAPLVEWMPQLRQQAETNLAALPGSDWEPKLGGVTRAVSVGAPIDEITKYAKEHTIDLIVQSTHGRTGLMHLLMGSVAESVVRYAPCPVLTVREKAQDFVEPTPQ